MNEPLLLQLELDFRTGRPTAITCGSITPAKRQACTGINRERTRGIKEATRPAPSREPIPVDGWHALVAARAAEWSVPLIPLEALGISFDEDQFICSKFLRRLGWGAEAIAWADDENACVYKLFEVHPNSALGKKLRLEKEPDGFRMTHADADLDTTLEKLCVLHDAGACPTEIVGLAESGDYLIVKQPLCLPLLSFATDRKCAAEKIHAVVPKRSIGREVRVFWLDGQAWCIGDLHENNIMRELDGSPTIIDALICPLQPVYYRQESFLQAAVRRARDLREGRTPASDDPFEGVSDEDF